MSRLAVSKVGQGDTEEIVKAVAAGVVTVVVTALTVQSKVPFSWEQQGVYKNILC